MKKENKGFTLIELLVVIAIIAILSTVVMAGLNSARSKGRDAKRLADVKAMQSALELYFDTCGGYPDTFTMPTNAADAITIPAGVATPGTCASNLGTFIKPLPLNPAPGGANYAYVGAGTPANSSYNITFSLEAASGSIASGAHTATPAGLQ